MPDMLIADQVLDIHGVLKKVELGFALGYSFDKHHVIEQRLEKIEGVGKKLMNKYTTLNWQSRSTVFHSDMPGLKKLLIYNPLFHDKVSLQMVISEEQVYVPAYEVDVKTLFCNEVLVYDQDISSVLDF